MVTMLLPPETHKLLLTYKNQKTTSGQKDTEGLHDPKPSKWPGTNSIDVSASSCKCSAVYLTASSRGQHTCPFGQSTRFHSQKPASLAPLPLASWRRGVAEVRKEKGIIIALYQHSPDSGEITAARIQGSQKQISLYLSKQSEMVRIDMALSFVNRSPLLSLLSKPHSHSLSTNPNPPCHLGSALESLQFMILGTTKRRSLVLCKIGLPIWGK